MVEKLRRDRGLKVTQSLGTSYQYFAFNFNDPVFRDVRVRQVLAYGIDRESIIKYLWRNQARPAMGALPPCNWAYNGGDPQRARELLRETGQDHLKLTYRLNNDNGTRRKWPQSLSGTCATSASRWK